LVEVAYQAIRRRILDNVYPPGFQALEQSLATEFGISRTPMREALIRLHNEGLVAVLPRHGMRVLPVSPTDMKEIYEILTALEAMAAELAARRKPTRRELAPLEIASHDMAKALKADDLDAWAEADARFHRQLIELSGNRMLVDAVLGFWDRAHRARMVTLRMRPKPTMSTREHLEIVEVIRKGDVSGAFDAARKHRERGSREQLQIIEHYRLQHL
jgi:DNA-binding GntR family transcriptional regulator